MNLLMNDLVLIQSKLDQELRVVTNGLDTSRESVLLIKFKIQKDFSLLEVKLRSTREEETNWTN